jgi:membrane fusion protein, copper/silver efflux system
MNKKPLWIAIGVLSLALGGFAVYQFGKSQGMAQAPTSESSSAVPTAGGAPTGALPQSIAEGEEATRRHVKSGLKAGDMDPVTGQKILYYHDPMVPGNKFDAPAKSPFMDMMLVPVYAGGDGDQGKVTVSPRVQQNLGVRTAEVIEGTLSPQVSSVGSIAFNERDQVIVQARATGYVERLLVRATLDPVRAGQPLAELYVPDWIAAQEEFLSVRRMQGSELGALVDGARQRMRQVGMSDALIRQVEETGKTQLRFTLTAPIGGVVVELMAREGMTVSSGATLFRINGLGTVWANAEVPESQTALLRAGAKVQAQSPAVPGSTFSGRVQAILPEVNPATRTLKARMELSNPGGRLVPGMFVSMNFMDTRPEKALLVPSEAVIQTGKRTVVMLAEDNGHFRPVEVRAGIESGGQTEIKQGLQAGQRVVSSSQFLIDSEASLRGLEARLNDAPDKKAEAEGPRYEGQGKVVAVGRDALTIAHEAIPALKWKPMTMDFRLPPKGLPRGMTEGDRIDFTFTMPKEGPPALTWVTLLAPEPAAAASAASTAGSRK